MWKDVDVLKVDHISCINIMKPYLWRETPNNVLPVHDIVYIFNMKMLSY